MHEMTKNDSAMYYEKAAWHGLGRIVEDATSPAEALEYSGLDWEVYKARVMVSGIMSDDYCGVVRDDIKKIIGVVSPSYKTVQNWEAFDIAKSFGSDVVVESAGSVQDGRKAYLLLRGDSFDAHYGADEVCKYMALMWSHDGTQALTVLPTSVRVVCERCGQALQGARCLL